MQCQRCKSRRVAAVTGKTADLNFISMGEFEHEGYVPDDMNIGDRYGDYLNFDLCLDCGQMQGNWPLRKTELEKQEGEQT